MTTTIRMGAGIFSLACPSLPVPQVCLRQATPEQLAMAARVVSDYHGITRQFTPPPAPRRRHRRPSAPKTFKQAATRTHRGQRGARHVAEEARA